MKHIFTIIGCLCLTNNLNAQSEFAPLGARWNYYAQSYLGSAQGTEQITQATCDSSYTHDGKLIKVIKTETVTQNVAYNNFAGAYQFSNRISTSTIDSFYQQNDTIFVYNHLLAQYTPLYINSAQVGDTLKLATLDTNYYFNPNAHFNSTITNDDNTFTLLIDSIKTLNLNGVAIEVRYTSPVFETIIEPGAIYRNTDKRVANWTTDVKLKGAEANLAVYPVGAYIKNIGGLGGGLLPRNELIGNGNIADANLHILNQLVCYRDSTMDLQFMDRDCFQFTINQALAVKEVASTKSFDIFPNPAKNTLHINFIQSHSPASVKMINMLGQEVKRTQSLRQSKNEIAIDALPAGTYFLLIEAEGSTFSHKFVKQ